MNNAEQRAPLAVTIPTTCQMTGLGRSTIYGLIARNELQTVKIGRRRLILVEDLRTWLQSNRQSGAA